MTIVQAPIPENTWTKKLQQLDLMVECLEEDVDNYDSLRTTTQRLKKKGFLFTIRRKEGKVRVWRLK